MEANEITGRIVTSRDVPGAAGKPVTRYTAECPHCRETVEVTWGPNDVRCRCGYRWGLAVRAVGVK